MHSKTMHGRTAIRETKPPTLHLKISEPSSGNPGRKSSKDLGRGCRFQNGSAELKPTIPNQIPISTFWSHFSRLSLKYLDDPAKIFDPTPFHYSSIGQALSGAMASILWISSS
jgi:hypothetical protein